MHLILQKLECNLLGKILQLNTLFDNPCKVEFFIHLGSSWALPPRSTSSRSKLEGAHDVILRDFPFSWSKQHVYSFFSSPNPSREVVHNNHLVLRDINPTQFGHHMWKTLTPKFGSCISATHGTVSQQALPTNQQVLHDWSMRFSYVIFAHIVVDTTLH
jgi:hypothetical protein